MKKITELVKHYEVRLLTNNTFKVVETDNFHPSQKTDIGLFYDGTTKEEYNYLVAEEKNIVKAKQKIAKYFIKESKKKLDFYNKRVNLFNKILWEIK
jgi:predicted glutamine amidotransferase